MNNEPLFHTRRQFLKTGLVGGALSWTVPAFLSRTFNVLGAEGANSAVQTATGKDGPILVVLQMAGGNDGLNTVVPVENDFYIKARPKLGITADKVLKLDGAYGFHPALAGFKSLYDAGHLSVIQGIGYPNPNRSHFRSTEIWQTASDSGRFENYGWLGRYFDNACAGSDATVGVSIGRQTPQAFAASKPTGVSLENPEAYRFVSSDKPRMGERTSEEKSFRKMNEEAVAELDDPTVSGGTIEALPGNAGGAGSAFDFLERTAMDAQVSSDKIRAIARKAQNLAAYPGSQIASSLKLIARLIGGGLPTRVYYVSQGGYDTHANQLGSHQRLLAELGDSVNAFVKDLKAQGNFDRVMIMTFSEFGRRVAENANGGTDHGAGAPMFTIAPKVSAGLLGKAPSLDPKDLLNGDVKFTTDFRSVYAGVLEGWLKTPSEKILGRKFEPLMPVAV